MLPALGVVSISYGGGSDGTSIPITDREGDGDQRLGDGQAVAWYLVNRGWAVRTSHHFLVFDAEEFGVRRPADPCLANGFLTPDEIGGLSVYAFYTCYHGDPGEPAYIHQIEDSLASVTYIHNGGDPWRGSPRTVYMRPGEKRKVGDLEVATVAVTKSMTSLGYLVSVDGLVIYYAGFQSEDLQEYEASIRGLAKEAERVDLAFLPIPEPGQTLEELSFVVQTFRPKAVFLLDPDRRERLFPSVARSIRSSGADAQVYCAKRPGDHFAVSIERKTAAPDAP